MKNQMLEYQGKVNVIPLSSRDNTYHITQYSVFKESNGKILESFKLS